MPEQPAAWVWSARAAYDLAFTTLLLTHPPLDVPRPFRAPLRSLGGILAQRFLGAYERHGGQAVDGARLNWFNRLSALRILTELEVTDDPSSHPFRFLESSARRLGATP